MDSILRGDYVCGAFHGEFSSMSPHEVKPLFNLYIDDSGTRNPDHAAPTSKAGDWFGLGGFIVRAEDEDIVRKMHADFCAKWSIDYPLHSVRIRHSAKNFSWLASLPQPRLREFFNDLDQLIRGLPIICHACVIDRPGYHARYYERHGRQRWHLCKSAFTILCERTAKFAIKHDRRVRIFVEETDKDSDRRIKEYFRDMRDTGMPFDQTNSDKYGPLSPTELNHRLIELRFKTKKSALIQLADLVLYPLCRAPYDQFYQPMKTLREAGKLVDHNISEEELPHMGIKYYCFDR